MNYELAYKIQMFPANVRQDRGLVETKLRVSGWPAAVLESDLTEALAWARSHCVVAAQEKQRKQRAAKKAKISSADALDAMFQSVGADPATIPRRAS